MNEPKILDRMIVPPGGMKYVSGDYGGYFRCEMTNGTGAMIEVTLRVLERTMKLDEVIVGQFAAAHPELQERIKAMGAYFHYRDGKLSDDGSVGSVGISYKQLLDLMAYWALETQGGTSTKGADAEIKCGPGASPFETEAK